VPFDVGDGWVGQRDVEPGSEKDQLDRLGQIEGRERLGEGERQAAASGVTGEEDVIRRASLGAPGG
jgi:hypothetical protein